MILRFLGYAAFVATKAAAACPRDAGLDNAAAPTLKCDRAKIREQFNGADDLVVGGIKIRPGRRCFIIGPAFAPEPRSIVHPERWGCRVRSAPLRSGAATMPRGPASQ
jgi:hypothetical protein